jgi:hypothetical protein
MPYWHIIKVEHIRYTHIEVLNAKYFSHGVSLSDVDEKMYVFFSFFNFEWERRKKNTPRKAKAIAK